MSLWEIKIALQSADADLCRAIDKANEMSLPETAYEIDRARSAIDSVLFEIERKRVPELANLSE